MNLAGQRQFGLSCETVGDEKQSLAMVNVDKSPSAKFGRLISLMQWFLKILSQVAINVSKSVSSLYVHVILLKRWAIIIHVHRLYLGANGVSMISQVSKIIIVLVNTSLRVRILAAAAEVKEGISISQSRFVPAGAAPRKMRERHTKSNHGPGFKSGYVKLEASCKYTGFLLRRIWGWNLFISLALSFAQSFVNDISNFM